MLMLWSDISVGDKIKFTKACVDYYLVNSPEWAKCVKGKIFNVSGVSLIFNSAGLRIHLNDYRSNYIDIYIDSGAGISWDFSDKLIEVVELGSS